LRASVSKRLAALEAKLQPARAVGNLNAEIKVMTSTERNALRDFLLFLKGGGQPGYAAFDNLKLAAEEAVYRARERLRFKD
jgi:hypothetical protein